MPTSAEFVYLAVALDAWSRKIVGWSMANHLRAELVVDALEMALGQRRPADGVIVHSGQGSQHTSVAFGERCKEAGIRPSMGSVGDAYDNALCESVSPRSNASHSTAAGPCPKLKPASRASASSKAGIIRSACIPL